MGVGDDVDVNELNMIATSANEHVFLFEKASDIFARLDVLTLALCSAHADIVIGKEAYVKLGRNDVRYFRGDLSNVKNGGAIFINIEELSGSVNAYVSFSHKNPQESTSDFRGVLENEKSMQFAMFVPNGAKYVYLALVSFNQNLNEVTVEINEF